MATALCILLGLVVLFLGRIYYGLFVAIAGVFAGYAIADVLLPELSNGSRFAIASGAAVVGALVSVFLQRIGLAIGGFYAGSYLGVILARDVLYTGIDSGWLIAEGLTGAVMAVLFPDWSIVIASSLIGAGAVVGVLHENWAFAVLLFLFLVACGIEFQIRWPKRD